MLRGVIWTLICKSVQPAHIHVSPANRLNCALAAPAKPFCRRANASVPWEQSPASTTRLSAVPVPSSVTSALPTRSVCTATAQSTVWLWLQDSAGVGQSSFTVWKADNVSKCSKSSASTKQSKTKRSLESPSTSTTS